MDYARPNKGRQLGGMAALMAAQAALASRLRDQDGLGPPCSYKISVAGFTLNRDVCEECRRTARPQADWPEANRKRDRPPAESQQPEKVAHQ